MLRFTSSLSFSFYVHDNVSFNVKFSLDEEFAGDRVHLSNDV